MEKYKRESLINKNAIAKHKSQPFLKQVKEQEELEDKLDNKLCIQKNVSKLLLSKIKEDGSENRKSSSKELNSDKKDSV